MTEEKKAISIVAVCIVIIAAGLFFLRDREPPAAVTRQRLATLEESIKSWAAENGRVPDTLESMGLPDDAIRDHAGNVFEYSASEGGTIKLLSFGADGKPGGHMFHADNEVTFQIED